MAEKENLQLAEQMIAAVNASDLNRYMQQIDPAYIGESEMIPEPVRGPEGARRALNIILTAFPDLRIEVEQMLASRDFVVVRARLTGTQKGTYAEIAPTNKSVAWRACDVVELRNGKAIRDRVYADNVSLLQQIGAISIPKATAAR
jgi:predicted ester cyclase